MSSKSKGPNKGAAGRLRDLYNRIAKKILTDQERRDLEEIFKKKDDSQKTENTRPQKIAKPNQDAGLA